MQLAGDFERGHIFTDRILHLRGRQETLLLGAATMRGILERLLKGLSVVTEYVATEGKVTPRYPLLLTTGRIMFHYHTGSMTRRSPKLENEAPEAYVEIHADDARQLGLTRRDKRVRVSSRRGEIELGARITNRIRRGVVYIPFHWAEAAANVLTNDALDPVTKTPEYKVCAVKVEAA